MNTGSKISAPTHRPGAPLDEAAVAAWRQEFPLLETVNYMANCSQGPQSRRARAALDHYLDSWVTAGMDWDYWCEEVARAKAEFARLIGASPDEIAVSTSVSEIVASVAGAFLPWGDRRKVVTTEAEFPTVGQVWLAHRKFGAAVDYVPVTGGEIPLEEYERHIDDSTLLASVTHVYYQNGFKQDLSAIAAICHSHNVPLLVDAYQSLGTVALDVKAQKIDMLCSGNLKYLLGIPGIAFLYVDRALADTLAPSITGWFGQDDPFNFQARRLSYAPGTRRFDTGTPPVMAAFAARAGMELINEAGPARIQQRIDFLSGVALEAADRLALPVLSPRDIAKKGATTAIALSTDSHAMEEQLKARGVVASARGPAIRIAPHFFSRPEEIVAAMETLRQCIDENCARA